MKKRNDKIIQITGIRGLLMVCFIVACLVAGFIVFPGYVAMHIWNYIVSFTYVVPAINIYQGVLLWGIFAIIGFIINDKKRFLVAYKNPAQLSEEEMKKLMERVKLQSQARMLNSMIINAKDYKDSKDLKVVENKENIEHIEKENSDNQEKDIHKV